MRVDNSIKSNELNCYGNSRLICKSMKKKKKKKNAFFDSIKIHD